jgi:hypothetical protein
MCHKVLVEELILKVREAAKVESSVPAQAWYVKRLDGRGNDYFLVVFGQPTSSTAVAAIDAVNGQILSYAHLRGQEPHFFVSEAEAAKRAGFSGMVQTDLVWQPSRSSMSPLYPIWRVTIPNREPKYVDQQGNVWNSLSVAGRGGRMSIEQCADKP